MIEYSCDSCGCYFQKEKAHNNVNVKLYKIYQHIGVDYLPFSQANAPFKTFFLCQNCLQGLKILLDTGTIKNYASMEIENKVNKKEKAEA